MSQDTWTTDKPTTPGVYWFDGYIDVGIVDAWYRGVVVVSDRQDVQFVGDTACVSLQALAGKWAGPMPPPRRPESVTVTYHDEAQGWVRREVMESQPVGAGVEAGRHEKVEAYGCTTEAQARRVAKWMLVEGEFMRDPRRSPPSSALSPAPEEAPPR